MKKSFYLSIALMFVLTISKAQSTAMDFNVADCNGTMQHLFADLDAGKAVLIHFYMPSCGSCPPPAQKIQAMANKIMTTHPGMVKGYAFPYNNTTTCSYSISWVTTNGLSLYTPMSMGATQVAYYGGFGMPTVVLLGGGTEHRVMFSTLSFANSDTTIMRDSILNFLNSATGINDVQNIVTNVSVYPNPASDVVKLQLNVLQSSNLKIEVVNMLGDVVMNVYESKTATGILKKEISTVTLANGIYSLRVNADGKSENYNFTVTK